MFDFGPLNKKQGTYELEEAFELLLREKNNVSLFRETINNQFTFGIELRSTKQRYHFFELLAKCNLEHIQISDEALCAYNVYLNQSDRILTAKKNKYLNLFHPKLTDAQILKMKKKKSFPEDLAGLLVAEIKALNIYTQTVGCRYIQWFLLRMFDELSNCSDDLLIEIFLLSMVATSALNKPLASGAAKYYSVYRGETSPEYLSMGKKIEPFYEKSNKIISTTTHFKVTERFVSQQKNEPKVRVFFPEVRGKEISTVSYYENEAEIIFTGHALFFTPINSDHSDVYLEARTVQSPYIEAVLDKTNEPNQQIAMKPVSL